jgi:hypothetical protein
MRAGPARCMEIIRTLIKREEQKKKRNTLRQAKKDFRKTLKKLWPSKLKEKQS